MAKRGFRRKSPEAAELLESVGRAFLEGYGHVVGSRDAAQAQALLAQVPDPMRGFAYEGAGMGAAMLDGLTPGRSHRLADLLAGPGEAHVYLIYVGVGWAMARLPRFRWPAAAGLDPLLRGLVLDGYGFHQAYFHTDRYVRRQYRPASFPWPADATRAHSHHTVDQGIGRALWFVGGTDAAHVADLIDAFAPERRADLYAGTGLAATYAGGVDAAELGLLAERAGRHRPQLAQASAFAAEARVRAGLTTEHTAVATGVLCGMTPERAAQVTQDLRDGGAPDGDRPAYETWRARIADQFVLLGGIRS